MLQKKMDMYGGAMNLLGEVSPGSIYSYIDRSLGAWDEQRPLFKANISSFVSLRKNAPPIPIAELRQITEIFTSQYDEYPLDPTYEPDKHEADVKEVNKEHEAIFAILQIEFGNSGGRRTYVLCRNSS